MSFDSDILEIEQDDLESSRTQPEETTHPARAFFHRLGLDTSQFPSVRFILETTEKEIRTGRSRIALRLPEKPGYVYDSIVRIARVLEVPQSHAKDHRKFLEVEWVVSQDPSLDEENHAALSFLAAQIECPFCHDAFSPEAEVLTENSLRISCPHCLNYWSMSVAADTLNPKYPDLLLDLFAKDQSKLKNLITRWNEKSVANDDKVFFQIFPYHFENWSEGTSLDWLFSENRGWSSLSNGGAKEFDVLFRAFLNTLTLNYFNEFFSSLLSSPLDQTEVKKKKTVSTLTEITPVAREQKNPSPSPFVFSSDLEATPTAAPTSDLSSRPENRFVWNQPITEVRSSPLPLPRETQKSSSFAFSLGALILVIAMIGSIFLFQYRNSELTDLKVTPVQERAEALTQLSAIPPSPDIQDLKTSEEVEKKSLTAEGHPQNKIKADEFLHSSPAAAPAAPEEKVSTPPPSAPRTPTLSRKTSFPPSENGEQRRLREMVIDSSFRQGMLHLKLQQASEAKAEFEKVLSLSPKHADAYRGLGLAQVYQQNFHEAVTSLSRYLELAHNASDRPSVEELITTLKERSDKD